MTTPSSSSIPAVRAIVTGHTHGLGAALAQQLLSRNISVLGLSRSSNPTLARSYRNTFDEIKLDLAQTQQLAHWLAGEDLSRFIAGAHCVLLLNNAGTVQPIGSLEQQTPDAIAHAIGLNVAAPLMLASAVACASTGGAERRIVHISSGAGRQAYAGWNIYCATKAALDHHARAVALEQNPLLRISSVAPGVVDTGMQAEIRSTSAEQFPLRGKFDELKRNGQLATPEQTAEKLIAYALSDAFGQTPVSDLRELA
ncbi:SDR family oxidoreductase [Paraburkholderia bonniea]|uniref:SDR family oxidoreductase n=1 Tax=Paraburkholderia bonniea TaxID=2152891 RepID=UPI00129130E9|nr:SDR family oxidoreductase [Paraburkholderia bonniea]